MSNTTSSNTAIYEAVKNALEGANKDCSTLLPSTTGESIYDIAVKHGYVGTEKEWMNYVSEGLELGNVLHSKVSEISALVNSIPTTVNNAITEAVTSIGFITIDSFETGATITQRNQALRHAATGNLYRWAGDLPKVVPASSTPLTSGGIGTNSWLVVSDLALADRLKSTTGAALVGIENKTVLDMLRPYAEHVFLETFRGIGFSDSQTINAALTHIKTNLAGKSTRLVFRANKTYVYDTTGDIRGISNLIIDLNGATLKRSDASATKTILASDIGTGQGTLPVVSVPDNWQIGDTLAAYSDTTHNNVTKGSAVITSINRVANKVYTTGGLGSTAAWTSTIPSGATVAKKFACFSGDKSDGVGAAINTQIKIINGTIDGNSTKQENYSWYFSTEVGMNGNGCNISKVNFKNTSGECIVGHGIDVNLCRFTNLNGSAFHLSVHDDTVAQGSISRFRNNYVDRVCLATNAVNGHSEGAVTFSWGAGRLIIEGNELKHGSESVFGGFGLEATNPDKWLIVRDNICSDFKQIFHSLTLEQSAVILNDNVFSNCGTNVNTLIKLSADVSSSVGHNAFVDGTGAGGRQRIREAIAGTAKTKHPSSALHIGSDVAGLDFGKLSGVVGITKEAAAYLAFGSSDTGASGLSFFSPSGNNSGSFYSSWEPAKVSYTLLGNIAGAKVHISKASLKLDTVTTYMKVYEDNAAALSGGLTAGDVYRTALGVLMVCF